MISKSFHRILDQYRKQTFTGPPENVRDHIMAATRALMRGNWEQAYGYVSSLNSWSLMPRKDEVGGAVTVGGAVGAVMLRVVPGDRSAGHGLAPGMYPLIGRHTLTYMFVVALCLAAVCCAAAACPPQPSRLTSSPFPGPPRRFWPC